MTQEDPKKNTNLKIVERVQTGIRIEKRILKVLKGLAEYYDVSLGDLVEGIVLHVFDGRLPFNKNHYLTINNLKQIYGLDLNAEESHILTESPSEEKYSFISKHMSRTSSITLNASVDRVFPLFDPVNEKKWAEGWEYEQIYPLEGSVEKGWVFKTQDKKDGNFIWLISRLDNDKKVLEYTLMDAFSLLKQIEIKCESSGLDSTIAHITYIYTGLDISGNNATLSFAQNNFDRFIELWGIAINHYLETGKPLQHH